MSRMVVHTAVCHVAVDIDDELDMDAAALRDCTAAAARAKAAARLLVNMDMSMYGLSLSPDHTKVQLRASIPTERSRRRFGCRGRCGASASDAAAARAPLVGDGLGRRRWKIPLRYWAREVHARARSGAPAGERSCWAGGRAICSAAGARWETVAS